MCELDVVRKEENLVLKRPFIYLPVPRVRHQERGLGGLIRPCDEATTCKVSLGSYFTGEITVGRCEATKLQVAPMNEESAGGVRKFLMSPTRLRMLLGFISGHFCM